MGLIKKTILKQKLKNPESRAFRREMARRIEGKHIRYVTERIDDIETVIGKGGGINIRDDELLVYASSKVLFRCKIDEMKAWELLSNDGVTLSAPDLENEGKERTIIAFYVYYR